MRIRSSAHLTVGEIVHGDDKAGVVTLTVPPAGPKILMGIGLLIAVAVIVSAFAMGGAWRASPPRTALKAKPALPSVSAADTDMRQRTPPLVDPTQFLPMTPEEARAANEKIPFQKGLVASAAPFRFQGTPLDKARATDCLAAAAWYEAGDDAVGQSSVVQVALNRIRHPAFPDSACAVVFQGAERQSGCQFTFTCDGSMLRRKPGEAAWLRARAIADSALSGRVDKAVGLATHYHTDWVMPYWSDSLTKISRVRTHLFFTWKGPWGSRAAFRGKALAPETAIAMLAPLSPSHVGEGTVTLPIDLAAMEDHPPKTATVDYAARAANFPTEAARGIQDLKGNHVIASADNGRRYLVALNLKLDPHIYALTALTLCRGKPECEVQGWSPNDAPQDFPASSSAAAKMRFQYRRTGGNEQARWDCTKVSRPLSAQCL